MSGRVFLDKQVYCWADLRWIFAHWFVAIYCVLLLCV